MCRPAHYFIDVNPGNRHMSMLSTPVLSTPIKTYYTSGDFDISDITLKSDAEKKFFDQFQRQLYGGSCFVPMEVFLEFKRVNGKENRDLERTREECLRAFPRRLWKFAFERWFEGIKFENLKGSSGRGSKNGVKHKHCRYSALMSECIVEFHCILLENGIGDATPGAYVTNLSCWRHNRETGGKGEALPSRRGPFPRDYQVLLPIVFAEPDDLTAEALQEDEDLCTDESDEESVQTFDGRSLVNNGSTHSFDGANLFSDESILSEADGDVLEDGSMESVGDLDFDLHGITFESLMNSGRCTPCAADGLPSDSSSKENDSTSRQDTEQNDQGAADDDGKAKAAPKNTKKPPPLASPERPTLKRRPDDDDDNTDGDGSQSPVVSGSTSPCSAASVRARTSNGPSNSSDGSSQSSNKKTKVNSKNARWEREPIDEDLLEDCARLFSAVCSLDEPGEASAEQLPEQPQPLQIRTEEHSGSLEAHEGNFENSTAQLQPLEAHTDVRPTIRPLLRNPAKVTTTFTYLHKRAARCDFYVRDESLGYPMLAKMLNAGAVRLNDECVRAVASFFSDQDLVELFQSRFTFHRFHNDEKMNMQGLLVSELGYSTPSVSSMSLSGLGWLPFHVEEGNSWMQNTGGLWSNIWKLELNHVSGFSSQALLEMTDQLPLLEDLTITNPIRSAGGIVPVLSLHTPRLRSLTMRGCRPDVAGSSLLPLILDLVVIDADGVDSKFVSALRFHCPQLRSLTLRGCKESIADASVEELCCGCSQLTKLVISGPSVSLGAQSIRAVACHLPCVQELELPLNDSNKEEVMQGWAPAFRALMSNCLQLQELHLNWPTVLALAFHHQDLFGRLQKLTVEGMVPRIIDLVQPLNCTVQDLTEVIPARFASLLHNLKHFSARLHSFNANAMVHHMALHMSQLESLHLSDCDALTDAPLMMLFANNKRLQSVVVRDGECLTDDVVVPLCAPGNVVREVRFCWSHRLTDTAVVAVAINCPSLEVLDVGGSLLDDGALDALANHARLLHELRVINSPKFTPHAIFNLVERCHRLQVLHVNESCLTEEQARGMIARDNSRHLLVKRCEPNYWFL